MCKRLLTLLTMIITICMLAFTLTACDSGDNTSLGGDNQAKNEIKFKTLTVDGTSVSGEVSEETETFSFVDEIECLGNAKFIVALDEYGSQQVLTKILRLEKGENKAYVFEMLGEEVKTVYEVVINRLEQYEITFNSNGGTAVEKQVVNGKYLTDIPTSSKDGYSFDGWDYDFTTPITSDITVNAKWQAIFTVKDNEIQKLTEHGKTLSQITIPASIDGVAITSIGEDAFRDCTSLVSVTIGNSVTSIGGWAFYNCNSLARIEIPNSVTSIGVSTFNGCKSLTSIAIPNSVTSIGSSAFASCSSLTSIEVDANNTVYGSLDGNLYNKNKTKLLQYAIAKTATSFTIPNCVTSIERSAFSNCISLTNITIPNSVTSIGNLAFYYCTSLTNIIIPNSVKNMGYSVFGNCTSLKMVTIENGVKTISSQMFCDCTSLASIEIPNSVTSIGDDAFYNCTFLTSITIPNSVTTINYSPFRDCTSLVIYCKATTKPSDWISYWNYSCPVIWDCNNNDVATNGYTYTVIDGIRYSLKDGEATVDRQISDITNVNIPSTVIYKGVTYDVTRINSYAFYYFKDSIKSISFTDTSTWYLTFDDAEWQDKVNGSEINVTNSTQNVTEIVLNFPDHYIYKK